MRLFMAIPVPEGARAALAEMQAKLIETRAQVRWVAPEQFHLTVKFLGETDEALVSELATRLSRAAAQVPAFPLEIEGLGVFPERGPARVIVAHVYSPDHRLTKLHRLVDSGVGGIGLPMDTRELNPHLTLGRVKSNHGLNRLLRLVDKHEADFLGAFQATEVVLFRSIATGEGHTHEVVHRAPLMTPLVEGAAGPAAERAATPE